MWSRPKRSSPTDRTAAAKPSSPPSPRPSPPSATRSTRSTTWGLRFIRIEAFDTDAAVTATELLRFGHSWAAVRAVRPSPAHPTGRYFLTLTPKAYPDTGVQAVHPDQ
ncbi:hypothetical protein [Streptomyces coelicoflavus]|uniref:hypothetical protein n=1 Tax=Streptomyces coelicoflavus TaxID=285562 RepID=UPI00363999C2